MPALARYHGPMLAVVTPEADTPNDIHRLVPDVQHDVMDGTSHWMQLDDPEGFNRDPGSIPRADRGVAMNRIVRGFAGRPLLARMLLMAVSLLAAACNNSGGRPGY